MSEYIEREAIIEEIRKYYYKNPPNSSYGEGFDRGLDRAQRAILDAPTIDAVPVVRCRECKYHNKPPCPMRLSFNWTEDNDFCSYGERMEK